MKILSYYVKYFYKKANQAAVRRMCGVILLKLCDWNRSMEDSGCNMTCVEFIGIGYRSLEEIKLEMRIRMRRCLFKNGCKQIF